MPDIVYRLGTEGDTPQTSRVFKTAINELYARRNVRLVTAPDDAWVPLHRHLLRHDGPRFWVAEQEGRVVGFSSGIVRGDWWFLATLFILPDYQRLGIGRALLERSKAGYPTPDGCAATMTDALQPMSNTLYARHGLFPYHPAVVFTGSLRENLERPRLDRLEIGPLSASLLNQVREVDAAATGLDRTPDHASFLADGGWIGWLFWRAGRPAGYVYIRPGGNIGPAATVRPADMEIVIRHALVELAPYHPPAVRVIVPGPNLHAQRPLWEAGLLFDEAPGLILMSRPFGAFDRYICGSFGLM